MQPSPYPHPQFPDVTLWDLPGASSPGCPADKYLKQVDFGRYDFFLLVSPRRCGAVETRLASEILRQGKQFYFARTRTQRPSGFSEAEALQDVREHCVERLRGAGVNDPRVFLVPTSRPRATTSRCSCPPGSTICPRPVARPACCRCPTSRWRPCGRRRTYSRSRCSRRPWCWASSRLCSGRPAAAYDNSLLVRSLRGYHCSFGPDDDSLDKLAEQVGKQAGDLHAGILSPLANEVSPETVLRLYSQSSDGAMREAGAFEKGIPLFGTLVAGGHQLQHCLHHAPGLPQRDGRGCPAGPHQGLGGGGVPA